MIASDRLRTSSQQISRHLRWRAVCAVTLNFVTTISREFERVTDAPQECPVELQACWDDADCLMCFEDSADDCVPASLGCDDMTDYACCAFGDTDGCTDNDLLLEYLSESPHTLLVFVRVRFFGLRSPFPVRKVANGSSRSLDIPCRLSPSPRIPPTSTSQKHTCIPAAILLTFPTRLSSAAAELYR